MGRPLSPGSLGWGQKKPLLYIADANFNQIHLHTLTLFVKQIRDSKPYISIKMTDMNSIPSAGARELEVGFL